MTELRDRRKARLVEALEEIDGSLTTKFLARSCGLDSRTALKLLCELQAEGLVLSSYDRVMDRRIHRIWLLRPGARA